MRIQAPNSAALAREAQAPKRAAAGAFSLDSADSSKPQAPIPTLRTVGGIDALVALQGLNDPLERRRRAVARGRVALDALDELKIGLLSGAVGQTNIGRLRSIAAELKDRSGEDGLDDVLSEIELRVEVEIAKMSLRAA
jgi:hypothetical protein